MSIRSTAKAVIIKDGKVLLNKCRDKKNGDYYSLKDSMQVSSEWVDIASLEQKRTMPKVFGKNIRTVIDGTSPVFLGSEHIDFNHG